MEAFKDVVIRLVKKYPLMQPCDLIKLTYQNEYGPAHLFKDKNIPLLFLKEEYEKIYHNKDEELIEDIGNNLIRVNLHAFSGNLETLNDLFLLTCNNHLGNHVSFLYKIDVIRDLAMNNIFSFSLEEFDDYLVKYERLDYPVVSHSDIYKQNYNPSYRVISKEYEKKIKDN